MSAFTKRSEVIAVVPNGSDSGKETSRKLPVSREKRSPFNVVVGASGVERGSALQRAHWGGSQELEERSEGATGVAWAWAGWEQPLYQKQHPGRLARTCKGDNRAGDHWLPRGPGWAGGGGWGVSPAAAPAPGGPPSPAPPRWLPGSPAPGPRREHHGSGKDWASWWVAQSARWAVPLASCVTSDRQLCLSEP